VQEEERQDAELLKLSRRQDRQNRELIDLSNQILSLTKEVRVLAGKADERDEQNKELLDLSKRTLTLTEELHGSAR
jgi:hypothetical protein